MSQNTEEKGIKVDLYKTKVDGNVALHVRYRDTVGTLNQTLGKIYILLEDERGYVRSVKFEGIRDSSEVCGFNDDPEKFDLEDDTKFPGLYRNAKYKRRISSTWTGGERYDNGGPLEAHIGGLIRAGGDVTARKLIKRLIRRIRWKSTLDLLHCM